MPRLLFPLKIHKLIRDGLLVVLSGMCIAADAATFILPPGDVSVIGTVRQVKAHSTDTLSDIAWQHDLGYDEIVLANPGVDPWLPAEGARVLLPTRYVLPDAPREGIVLNVPEMRLYYYPPPKPGETLQVMTFPVSIGRGDWETPLGVTTIVAKTTNPSWYPPASIREEHEARGETLPEHVPPGPGNPLGRFALRMGFPGYLIHGTNKPYGIGMRITHGCIRMYPRDIEMLYRRVTVGTPVHIVHQHTKLGWYAGMLFMEVHPPFGEPLKGVAQDPAPLMRWLYDIAQEWPGYSVDWQQVRKMATYPKGIPLPVMMSDYDNNVE